MKKSEHSTSKMVQFICGKIVLASKFFCSIFSTSKFTTNGFNSFIQQRQLGMNLDII